MRASWLALVLVACSAPSPHRIPSAPSRPALVPVALAPTIPATKYTREWALSQDLAVAARNLGRFTLEGSTHGADLVQAFDAQTPCTMRSGGKTFAQGEHERAVRFARKVKAVLGAKVSKYGYAILRVPYRRIPWIVPPKKAGGLYRWAAWYLIMVGITCQ